MTVADKNLRLGEAAKRGVGASSGQLPDMGLFAANFAGVQTLTRSSRMG